MTAWVIYEEEVEHFQAQLLTPHLSSDLTSGVCAAMRTGFLRVTQVLNIKQMTRTDSMTNTEIICGR